MLVSITDFGSVWRRRLSKDSSDPCRYRRAVYYNTTGVDVNGAIRQCPQIAGYARFHVVGGFDPNYPSRMIQKVFECGDPCVWLGENKILFERLLHRPEKPDRFLVVARNRTTGALKIGSMDWRSADTWLISFSECHGRQEAMLLMPAYGWIRTEVGRFVVEPFNGRPWAARLILVAAA